MKVKNLRSSKKCELNRQSDTLLPCSRTEPHLHDSLIKNEGSEKKPRERRSLGGKVEKKKTTNVKKWSILEVFGFGSKSSTKKKKSKETPGKSKKIKEVQIQKTFNCSNSNTGQFTTLECVDAGNTPKERFKVQQLSTPHLLEFVKLKENIPEKTNVNYKYSAEKPVASKCKRTPLLDLPKNGLTDRNKSPSFCLTNKGDKKVSNGYGSFELVKHITLQGKSNIINHNDATKITLTDNQDEPATFMEKVHSSMSIKNTPMTEKKASSVRSRNASVECGNYQPPISENDPVEKLSNKPIMTPNRTTLDASTKQQSAHKYSLRGAGSTPPRPPRPRHRALRRPSIKELNSKLKEYNESSNSSGVGKKPPIRKPPRRSLPLSKKSHESESLANISSVSLDILTNTKQFRKRGHFIETASSIKSFCNDDTLVVGGNIYDGRIDSKNNPKRKSLRESKNSPFMSPECYSPHYDRQDKLKDTVSILAPDSDRIACYNNVCTTPKQSVKLRQRCRSLSSGKVTLSESRLIYSRKQHSRNQEALISEYNTIATPKSRSPNTRVTRSQSLKSRHVFSRLKSPELTPLSAVAVELKEGDVKMKKKRKREPSLSEVISKFKYVSNENTDNVSVKKKPTPQKPPRKNLKDKTSIKNSLVKKRPSFIEHVGDNVAKVKRRLSRVSDMKHDMDLKGNEGKQAVNVIHAGQTPKPLKRYKNERVIL